MPMEAIIRSKDLISEEEILQMYDLYSRYYCNTSLSCFRNDLQDKDWVILQRSPDKTLGGFSTACCYTLDFEEQKIRVLFSGDTIIDQQKRSSSTLAGAFCHLVLRLNRDSSFPLYWLLITKGYRTYRFLPVFYNEFYPVCNRETPLFYKRLLNRICSERFGSAWNDSTGIINLGLSHERLEYSQSLVPPNRESDPHITFFLHKNPRYTQGTELACITLLNESNLNRAGQRAIKSTKVRWDEQPA